MGKFKNPWGPEGKYWDKNALQNNVLDRIGGKKEKVSPGIRTVRNVSKQSIWCKNEDDSGVFEVASGGETDKGIDGLTHWAKPKQVFKVAAGLDKVFGITVYDEGIAFDTAFWPLDKEFNALLGGGWLSEPPDDGWKPIFEKAGF